MAKKKKGCPTGKRKLSLPEQEFIANHRTDSLESLCKATGGSQKAVQTFLDALLPVTPPIAPEAAVAPASPFVPLDSKGAAIMTATSADKDIDALCRPNPTVAKENEAGRVHSIGK